MTSFETLKKKILYQFGYEYCSNSGMGQHNNVYALEVIRRLKMGGLGSSLRPNKLQDDLYNEFKVIINNWDIRAIYHLIELFPNCFPTFMRSGRYIIDCDNETGVWGFYEKEI